MNFNPDCPNCGKEIEFLEHYDLSDDGDIIIAYATGYCEECGTNYKWKDIYSLENFEDLEEI